MYYKMRQCGKYVNKVGLQKLEVEMKEALKL